MKNQLTQEELGALLKQFDKEYDFLYETHGQGAKVAGEDEAMEFGDKMIHEHDPIVAQFANYRHDILSSDREVMAFAFAVVEMGWR